MHTFYLLSVKEKMEDSTRASPRALFMKGPGNQELPSEECPGLISLPLIEVRSLLCHHHYNGK
jgi:hypothetical protein